MIVDMVGHATLCVETCDRRILFDPVLYDPHQEGLFEVFPPRRVLLDRMPPPDTLVVTHQHLDHFDIRSLAALSRDVEVIIPHDPLLAGVLGQLGFSRVHAVGPFSRIQLGDTTLFTTPSSASHPEIGVVVADADGVCWNTVDTALVPETSEVVESQFGGVDLLLAMWQPLLELNACRGEHPGFPFAAYGALLQRVYEIDPVAVVPASCGFRFTASRAWLDHRVFPITRERFCHDVQEGHPTLRGRVLAMDPGDRATIGGGPPRLVIGGCPWVERLPAEPGALDFWPAGVGPLVDQEPAWARPEEVDAAIDDLLDRALPAALAGRRRLAASLSRWGLIYQLEVVGKRRTWIWTCDFSGSTPQIGRRREPLANAFARVTASGVAGLMFGRHGWDHLLLGGDYQCHDRIYRATPAGLARPEDVEVPNMLMLVFRPQATFEAQRALELSRWSGS